MHRSQGYHPSRRGLSSHPQCALLCYTNAVLGTSLLLAWNNLLLSGKSKGFSAVMKVHDLAVCSSRGQCSGVWQVHVSPSKQILPFYHPGLVCSVSSEGHAGS